MNEIAIIVTEPDDWTASSLMDSVKVYGGKPIAVNLSTVQCRIDRSSTCSAEEIDIFSMDGIIVRDIGSGTLDEMAFRSDILVQAQEMGIPVINSPESIQKAANKYYSTHLFSKAGLPHPPTRAVQDLDSAMNVVEEFRDCIIKPIFGYKGMDILRIRNGIIISQDGRTDRSLQIENVMDRIIENRGVVYIQKFIENPGRDIRCFVVGGSVAGAILRNAQPGSWISNLSQGSIPEKYIPSEHIKEMACRAAETIGTVFSGVDIIEGPNGPVILEINATPSGAGIYRAWGINVSDHIVRYLFETIK
ncbi:tetrahydromethanopterin:alpha-L-glutamate ligase [Methanosalsum zhilinae]|nr:tetrahydromethanopterin:alpha-L-glutamate ligase [Methanosalsum zhilinae]